MSAVTATPAAAERRLPMHRRRKRVNAIALTLSLGAMAFGLFWLVWILIEVIVLGIGGLSWQLFTQSTPAPNVEGGGLANAIAGSFVMVLLATALGTPIGIFAGIYLAEYGQKGWLGATTRFINDILLSAPSIVIGLFIYAVVVAQVRQFSGYAGILALALIVIPVVVRTTENMLQLIPNALREAAYALGSPRSRLKNWFDSAVKSSGAVSPAMRASASSTPVTTPARAARSVTLKAAMAGVVTGVLLALARIAGETAPLLFTALSNQFFTWNLGEPTANLPVTIFKFAMSPFKNWQELAWAGVFLITLGVLALNIAARLIFRRQH